MQIYVFYSSSNLPIRQDSGPKDKTRNILLTLGLPIESQL
jgi:hypothetical protein